MSLKIGINGFGRIGRMVFRAVAREAEFANIEIVGINDLLEPDYLAYMLKYDSVHGNFKGEIKVEGNHLVVNGKKVTVGSKGDLRNPKLLYARASIKKPVISASTIKGGINPKNVNLKTKKWRKTVQAGGR